MKSQTLIVPLVAFLCWFQASGQQIVPNSAPALKDRHFDQTADEFSVGPVKGDVKTKAVYLPKPEYPLEARQVGVEGVVRVRISLDHGGAVEIAQILSGDPLLNGAAESAARRSKFRIARDAGGNAIKTDGVLEYPFEIKRSGWTKIAHSLVLLDRFPIATFSIPSARKAFQAEWTSEREMLEALDLIRRNSPRNLVPESPILMVPSTKGNTIEPGSRVVAQAALPFPPPISADQISTSRNLINAIRERLQKDELAAWQFEVGLKLDEAMMADRDPRDFTTSSGIIKSLIEKAPANVDPANLTALRSLETAFTKDRNSEDTLDEVRRAFLLVLRIA